MKRNEKYFREHMEEMINLMRTQAPEHHFEFHEPFWVLITTILSHRTKDEVTDRAARALEEKYHDMDGLSKASYEDVLKIIDKVGFKKAKAERVINAAKIIRERFGGEVPQTIEDLTEIPGVGRKTANVVLSDGFGIPAIAVDTHVQRICMRTGISHSHNPEDTEMILRRIVPEKLWLGLNPMMVEFGKTICKPVGPRCESCKINSFCDYYDSEKGKKGEERKGNKNDVKKKK